jgi:HPt (histidine-containing phosphotransfer) domain-containing protein
MAYDPGAIDAALAAAVGDEPLLIAELRLAFIASVEAALTQMRMSTDIDAWTHAARRMKGLAASFGAVRLMAAATAAIESTPHDTEVMRRIHHEVARL